MSLKIITLKVIFLVMMVSAARAAEHPISSGRTVEQRADSLYEMISKELVFTDKVKDKFKAIQSVIVQFKKLLQADDEIKPEQSEYIEQYIAALQSLPPSKGFKKSKCADYQVEEKAKALLESLCSQN